MAFALSGSGIRFAGIVRAPGARSGGQADRRSSLDLSLLLRKDSFPSMFFFTNPFSVRLIGGALLILKSFMKLVELLNFCLHVRTVCVVGVIEVQSLEK